MNKKIKNRIFKIRRDGILFGFLTIFIGYLALIKGHSRGGVVTPSASWIVISIGIFIIIYSTFRKLDPKKLKESDNSKNTICAICGEISTEKDIESKCDKCGGELEDTKGFLERHPDFIKKK